MTQRFCGPPDATIGVRYLAIAALVLALGCKARDMGVPTADKSAEFVDSSWVQATRSCWPELEHNGFSATGLKHNLADPLRFRSAFPSYAARDENGIRALVAKPLMSASAPDATILQNSRTPVLTRAQAVAGNGPKAAIVPGSSGAAPPDALCAIHAGIPVGFK